MHDQRVLIMMSSYSISMTGVLLSLEDTPSVSEADVILTVCVSAFGNLAGDERVTLITSDDTAKGINDACLPMFIGSQTTAYTCRVYIAEFVSTY